jgi:hypothetical protein
MLDDEPYGKRSFSYFFSSIKGTKFEAELMNTKYYLIERKFISILDDLSGMVDNDYKIDDFSNLISSIRETHLLEEKITDILSVLDKVKDSYVKRNVFQVLIYTLRGTHLLEEYFSSILISLEKIEDKYEREHAFDTLIYSIKGKGLVRDNFTTILKILDNFDDDELKRSAFYNLTPIIGKTDLLEERLADIMTFLDGFSTRDKISAFSDIINTIRVSKLQTELKITKYMLFDTKFPTVLNTLVELDDMGKRRALCNLMFSIKGTPLLEINFRTILDTIDTIVDETHKRFSLSYVVSAIKETKLYNEKVLLIKERFPQYFDE